MDQDEHQGDIVYSESRAESSESEESSDARSEHGDTTDAENEIIYYWEGLRRGILSYPVPLRLQCLLYIIGHLIIDEIWTRSDGIPINSLALLPRMVRVRLLLLLPAADVAKLEGTPVTNDISMDEVWETLYKERMPWDRKDEIVRYVLGFDTPDEIKRSKKIESVSWKEAYFSTLFSFTQMYHCHSSKLRNENCECVYDHFLPDLLFGIGKAEDLYQCFDRKKTLSIHNVYRCAHQCDSLTTIRNQHRFSDPAISVRRYHSGPDFSIWCVIEAMTKNGISLKHISFSPIHLSEMIVYFKDQRSCKELSKCLSSVESVSIRQCAKWYPCNRDEAYEAMNKGLEMIFVQNKCAIKSALIQDSFEIVLPYLASSPECNLKKLELHVELDKETTDLIKKNKSDDSVYHHFKRVTLSESLSLLINQVIQRHQELESFEFAIHSDFDFGNCIFMDSEIIRCLGELMYRPTFKELIFNSYRLRRHVSFDNLHTLMHQFFSSPYPVSITLFLSCPQFDPIPEPLPVNLEQASFKSLHLQACELSFNFVSLLPQYLTLKSLNLDRNDWNIISLFANLQSITVDSFTLLTYDLITEENISDICSLFRIVSAQEWILSIDITEHHQDTVDMFLSSLSNIKGTLTSFELLNDDLGSIDKALSFFDSIFMKLLPPSEASYFELSLSLRLLTEDLARALLDLWKKLGVGKLKKFKVFSCPKDKKELGFESTLLEMSNEIEVEKDQD